MDIANLVELIKKIVCIREWEEACGSKMFMGIPESWTSNPHWRCENDHVSTVFMKSEAKCSDLCLQCFAPVALTFPEDRDGPLVHPALEKKVVNKDSKGAALRRVIAAQDWALFSDERGLAMDYLDALLAENADLKTMLQPHTEPAEAGLPPCPFCGSASLHTTSMPRFPGLPREWDGSMSYAVVCGACAAQGGWEKSLSGARRTWSTRTP